MLLQKNINFALIYLESHQTAYLRIGIAIITTFVISVGLAVGLYFKVSLLFGSSLMQYLRIIAKKLIENVILPCDSQYCPCDTAHF